MYVLLTSLYAIFSDRVLDREDREVKHVSKRTTISQIAAQNNDRITAEAAAKKCGERPQGA